MQSVFLDLLAAASIRLRPDADRTSGASELSPAFLANCDFPSVPTKHISPLLTCVLFASVKELEAMGYGTIISYQWSVYEDICIPFVPVTDYNRASVMVLVASTDPAVVPN